MAETTELADDWSCGICDDRDVPDKFRVFGICYKCAAAKSINNRDLKISQLKAARSATTPMVDEELAALLREFCEWRDRAQDEDDDCEYLNHDGFDDLDRLAERARAILSGLPPQPNAHPVGWQPIETAPRDETDILARADDGRCFVVWWRGKDHLPHQDKPDWCIRGTLVTARHLVGWRPLPAAGGQPNNRREGEANPDLHPDQHNDRPRSDTVSGAASAATSQSTERDRALEEPDEHGPFGPMGSITGELFLLIQEARKAGDERLLDFATWAHERICLMRYQMRKERWPDNRPMPPKPTAIRAMKGSDGWRPIETAPKDGALIAVRGSIGPYGITEWRGEAKWGRPVNFHRDNSTWLDRKDAVIALAGYSPTHWQPLPSPPDQQSQKQGS